jgi:hypothetical protein
MPHAAPPTAVLIDHRAYVPYMTRCGKFHCSGSKYRFMIRQNSTWRWLPLSAWMWTHVPAQHCFVAQFAFAASLISPWKFHDPLRNGRQVVDGSRFVDVAGNYSVDNLVLSQSKAPLDDSRNHFSQLVMIQCPVPTLAATNMGVQGIHSIHHKTCSAMHPVLPRL